MGTRSTTKIYDMNGELILALYKQYDGYTEGWGNELKSFIESCLFCNGISSDEQEKAKQNNLTLCNGMGCFALQLVKHFKEETGGLYATCKGDIESYNYRIEYIKAKSKEDFDKIVLSCKEEESFRFEFETELNSYFGE